MASQSASYTALTEKDLYDATANLIGQGSSSQIATEVEKLQERKGWFLKLEHSGEKVLASATSYQNVIYFTSYTPDSSDANGCEVPAGISRLYRVNVTDATPVAMPGHSGEALTKEDRSEILGLNGISPTPTYFKVPNESNGYENIICIGTECKKTENTKPIIPTFWRVE